MLFHIHFLIFAMSACEGLGPCTARSTLWLIQSHQGATHLHRQLKTDLIEAGVESSAIDVVYGCQFDECFLGERKVKGNEITEVSFKYKWLPRETSPHAAVAAEWWTRLVCVPPVRNKYIETLNNHNFVHMETNKN